MGSYITYFILNPNSIFHDLYTDDKFPKTDEIVDYLYSSFSEDMVDSPKLAIDLRYIFTVFFSEKNQEEEILKLIKFSCEKIKFFDIDMTIKNDHEPTILCEAVDYNNIPVVCLLLEYGANPNKIIKVQRDFDFYFCGRNSSYIRDLCDSYLIPYDILIEHRDKDKFMVKRELKIKDYAGFKILERLDRNLRLRLRLTEDDEKLNSFKKIYQIFID